MKRFTHGRGLALTAFLSASFLGLIRMGDAQQESDVPKGEVAKYTFTQSKIFPGTTRTYSVYVPRQYDPTKPACVHVNQDGVQFNAPAVFDKLIAAKEMPVTIGVFVTPGIMKAESDKALDRNNRSYEYDGMSDEYARFLLTELLPEVEKKTTQDGRAIHLSHNGNDRSIAGTSSGAIAAFTAAWERPDAFTRVFSGIGTYVGLRGGNEYPTLIRKFEPKPIRVFLQDGSGDLDIYGGNLWLANQEMERALAFSGYEVNHEWGTEGHNGNHATKIFPEAMKWLWKDWPQSVKAGKGSDKVREVVLEGEGWKEVVKAAAPIKGAEISGIGALTVNAKGEVVYCEGRNGTIRKISAEGQPKVVGDTVYPLDSTAVFAFSSNGRLYASKGNEIWSFADDGKTRTDVKDFKASGLVVLNNGLTFISGIRVAKVISAISLSFESEQFIPNPNKVTEVWSLNSGGDKKKVDHGLKTATGIALSPDQTLLYVAESETRWVYSYQIQPDGSLKNKQRYFHLHVPDDADDSARGMCVDRDGRLYVATRMGIQISDQMGRVQCILPTPNGKATSICFGGANFDTLFAACGDTIYMRKMRTRGANAFEAPIKPAPPKA